MADGARVAARATGEGESASIAIGSADDTTHQLFVSLETSRQALSDQSQSKRVLHSCALHWPSTHWLPQPCAHESAHLCPITPQLFT